MAIIFQETFTGTAGSINGKLPDTPDSVDSVWAAGSNAPFSIDDVLLDGSGHAVSDNTDPDFFAPADIGLIMAAPVSAYTATVVFKTRSDMTGTIPVGGLGCFDVSFVGSTSIGAATIENYAYLAADEVTGWQINVYNNDTGLDEIFYVTVADATTYTWTFTFNAGIVTFTGMGASFTQDLSALLVGDTFELESHFFQLGGDAQVDSITITDTAPAPVPTCRVAVPAILTSVVTALGAQVHIATAAAPTPMGAVAVLANFDAGAIALQAHSAAPAILASGTVRAYHDFSGQLGDATTLFVMDLITPTGAQRVPISSWQATLQTGSSNYVQCVVPACAPWIAAINSATEFVIYRRAEVPGAGLSIEYEMARSAAEQAQFDQGPQRYTCTLSGYTDAFAEDLDPAAAFDRTLTGVRSVSSGPGGLRVRCAIDWLLRPGQRAYVQGLPFVVSYLNYYAPSGFDAYMDAGGS